MNCQRICNVIPENKLCIVFETEKESFVYCRIYSDWERGSFHIPFSSETDSICIITMIFSLFFARLSVSAYPFNKWKWSFFCLSEIYCSSVSKSFCCLFFMINLQFSDCFLILTAFSFLLFFSRFTQFFLSERAFVKFIQLIFDMAPHVTHTHCFYL